MTDSEITNAETSLRKLLSLSQALLECDDNDTRQLEELLLERELLLTALREEDISHMAEIEKKTLRDLIADIQAKDLMIEKRFREILGSQGKQLQQMLKGRKALAGYRFPYISQQSAAENNEWA